MALRHGKMSALEYRAMSVYSQTYYDPFEPKLAQYKELANKIAKEYESRKQTSQPNNLLLLLEEQIES